MCQTGNISLLNLLFIDVPEAFYLSLPNEHHKAFDSECCEKYNRINRRCNTLLLTPFPV